MIVNFEIRGLLKNKHTVAPENILVPHRKKQFYKKIKIRFLY